MLEKCGVYDDIVIYHHPTTNKHLGVARIIFENVKAARQCVEKYNQKSVMGKVINVFVFYVLGLGTQTKQLWTQFNLHIIGLITVFIVVAKICRF